LIRGALEIARTQGLKVKAVCPFAKAYLDRHPEYADLRQ
jgi:predicted GNAT family acetyltransferase